LAPLIRSSEFPDTTNAATVDSAKDPNKSDPIPAISPTLSTILLTIVDGFLLNPISYYNMNLALIL